MRAPVPHTCPQIDKVIRAINSAVKSLQICEKEEDVDAIKSNIRDAIYEIEDIPSEIEELRSDNDRLRTWGYENVDEVQRLEKELEELKSVINNNLISE